MAKGLSIMLRKTFYFISGLPRAGSTMLSAILIQNPDFYAHVSSPVFGLVDGVISGASAGTEFASLMTIPKREAVIRGIFDTYYADRPERVIFDTNRAWTSRMPLLHSLFGEVKVIAMVRNVAWIMDSMERMYRRQPFEHTRLFSPAERSTVYTRVEALGQKTRLVGLAWASLREAMSGEFASSILLVDYDHFVDHPAESMERIYEFIGTMPKFYHDFNELNFDAVEFDNGLGVSDLHKVRKCVSRVDRTSILPSDLFSQYSKLNFWE